MLVLRPPIRDHKGKGYKSQRKGGEEQFLIIGFGFIERECFSHGFARVHRVE